MSILAGNVEKVDGIAQFRTDLHVSRDELWEILPEENKEELRKYEADRQGDDCTVDDVDIDDIPEMDISETISNMNTFNVIPQILENRDRVYTHHYDGYIHTITHVYTGKKEPVENRDEYTDSQYIEQ